MLSLTVSRKCRLQAMPFKVPHASVASMSRSQVTTPSGNLRPVKLTNHRSQSHERRNTLKTATSHRLTKPPKKQTSTLYLWPMPLFPVPSTLHPTFCTTTLLQALGGSLCLENGAGVVLAVRDFGCQTQGYLTPELGDFFFLGGLGLGFRVTGLLEVLGVVREAWGFDSRAEGFLGV